MTIFKLPECKWIVEVCSSSMKKMPAQKGYKRKSRKMAEDLKEDQGTSSSHIKKDLLLPDFAIDPSTVSFTQNGDNHDDKVLTHLTSDEFPCGSDYQFNEEIPVVGYVSDSKTSAMQLFKEDSWESPLHNKLKDVTVISGMPLEQQSYPSNFENTLSRDFVKSQLVTKNCVCLDHDTSPSGSCSEIVNCSNRSEMCPSSSSTSARNSKTNDVELNINRRSGSQRCSRNELGSSDNHGPWVCEMNESSGNDNRKIDVKDSRYSGLVSLGDNVSSHLPLPVTTECDVNRSHSAIDDLRKCGSIILDFDKEPIHMTLEEVRSSIPTVRRTSVMPPLETHEGNVDNCLDWNKVDNDRHCKTNGKLRRKKLQFGLCTKTVRSTEDEQSLQNYHVRCLPRSFKHTLCHWLGIDKNHPNISNVEPNSPYESSEHNAGAHSGSIVNRALPPVPPEGVNQDSSEVYSLSSKLLEGDTVVPDFASSIQKVKDYGWYWGPISGEMAEKILLNEPDGSFIVRDSSDEHYIFSLTFKLNGFVRHVRIEHDHGNFSFGTFTIFKSHTIVEFIENAVQHSRSGRYLFFLHRRPLLGPMRVQLLHPVSRFKQVQSLQHMCRFVILKVVRRDLIKILPLPKRLQDYLNTPHYYAEQMQDWPVSAANSQSPHPVQH